jgi:hypothetical protein
MKIALLNTYRVIQGRGGAEKVFCELANGFAQCGHEVLALAYDEAEIHWIVALSLLIRGQERTRCRT